MYDSDLLVKDHVLYNPSCFLGLIQIVLRLISCEKTGIIIRPPGKKKNFDDTFSSFDTTLECYGRTDRQMELLYQYCALYS